MKSFNNKTVEKIGLGVAIALSALSSFGFFSLAVSNLLPPSIPLADSSKAIISGIVGVILLEGCTMLWLHLYLQNSENEAQRSIAIRAFWVTLTLSLSASALYIFLFAFDMVTLNSGLRDLLSILSGLMIAFSAIFFFYSIIDWNKNNEANRQRIREANRAKIVEEAEDEALAHVDDLIAQKIKEQLDEKATQIAQERARRVVRERIKMDLGKGYMPKEAIPVEQNGHAEGNFIQGD